MEYDTDQGCEKNKARVMKDFLPTQYPSTHLVKQYRAMITKNVLPKKEKKKKNYNSKYFTITCFLL